MLLNVNNRVSYRAAMKYTLVIEPTRNVVLGCSLLDHSCVWVILFGSPRTIIFRVEYFKHFCSSNLLRGIVRIF